MNNSAPEIDCPKCVGSGKITLNHRLADTLKLVKKHKKVTARFICELIDFRVQPSAINNRLELLRKMELVKRVRSGASYLYSPA